MTKRKMSEEKKQRLRETGWDVESVTEFMKLSPEEQKEIEKRLIEERKK